MPTEAKETKKLFNKVLHFIRLHWLMLLGLTYVLFVPLGRAGAAEAQWSAVIDFLVPWIERLGGVVMLLGGIMFGLAFKNDDADGKTRALQTLVAGAIVIAVGVGYDIFIM